ncbi:hypothetical protein FRC15_010442 [Serendipita sp. 397]|nr:hypothetical protein FRC15_010442 [Serendipita sp. 397]
MFLTRNNCDLKGAVSIGFTNCRKSHSSVEEAVPSPQRILQVETETFPMSKMFLESAKLFGVISTKRKAQNHLAYYI